MLKKTASAHMLAVAGDSEVKIVPVFGHFLKAKMPKGLPLKEQIKWAKGMSKQHEKMKLKARIFADAYDDVALAHETAEENYYLMACDLENPENI